MSAEVAAATAAPMKDMFNLGTARTSRVGDGVPLIAKTGTTDAAVDTWMIGSSTAVTTAVWVGNVVGKVPVLDMRGGTLMRHNVFRVAQGSINAQYGGGDFGSPPARLLTGAGVIMPDVAGRTPAQAEGLLTGLGFRFAVGDAVDSDLAAGLIVSASPEPGTLLARGTTVTVTTSLGNLVPVPDVVSAGTNFNTARDALLIAGFTNISRTCVALPPAPAPDPSPSPSPGGNGNSSPAPLSPERVTAQNPAAGTTIRYETPITLTVTKSTCP
jgi:membrane peptidoglycan carboxypeptidase